MSMVPPALSTLNSAESLVNGRNFTSSSRGLGEPEYSGLGTRL